MNKEELLQELSAKIQTGEISHQEVVNLFISSPPEPQQEERKEPAGKILYLVGAVIITLGIIALGSQIWDDIGSFGRIFVTLGFGLVFAAIGSFLFKEQPEADIGPIFHLIGGILIPSGAVVALSELGLDLKVSRLPLALTFGTLSIFYLLLSTVHRHVVLTFFALANGTLFTYLFIESLLEMSFDLYTYLTMIVGANYLLFAQAFRGTWSEKLLGVLHFFGALFVLGAAFSQALNSSLWESLYFVLVLGSFFLSVRMRSRSILALSTLFLIVHVSYITSKHFADTIGWPVALVLLGFLFIGLGYASVSIDKNYIRRVNYTEKNYIRGD